MALSTNSPTLSSAQNDRVAGVIYVTAVGDALGAPYEFKPPVPATTPIVMHAGGPWELGEWTDDTSMGLVIAWAALRGANLRDEAVQDQIVADWVVWTRQAKDVGIMTSAVLGAVSHAPTAAASLEAASRHHDRTGRSGGNGSLMRTAPVALAYLHDEKAGPVQHLRGGAAGDHRGPSGRRVTRVPQGPVADARGHVTQ